MFFFCVYTDTVSVWLVWVFVFNKFSSLNILKSKFLKQRTRDLVVNVVSATRNKNYFAVFRYFLFLVLSN